MAALNRKGSLGSLQPYATAQKLTFVAAKQASLGHPLPGLYSTSMMGSAEKSPDSQAGELSPHRHACGSLFGYPQSSMICAYLLRKPCPHGLLGDPLCSGEGIEEHLTHIL